MLAVRPPFSSLRRWVVSMYSSTTLAACAPGAWRPYLRSEIRAMIDVDLLAPILLTRAALPHLWAHRGGLVVNITSAAALVGVPFYATYAAPKAGLAHYGEALRRELKDEGVDVLIVCPAGADTPMMKSSRAGPDLGFALEPASAGQWR
jgi:uncharacterized oxidoreductase